ncbi:hypothetical protein GYMLUDRAFT_97668 [Collybiopsis luxurians FD-317 M1]|uniref:DUF6534 domain-containing protein n=1 Tax=Collybiopsis luxurians FD-317 M1 TaxID=944289 RepID=A0A0D0B7S2_9AGAR|nr:hypothetical protein GYMLUDRAFT_97668 [Collybiopsis luxurians FD-317 M1]
MGFLLLCSMAGNTNPSATQSLSAYFFGFVTGTVLFGIVLREGYRYFKTCNEDSLKQRLLVAILCILDVFHFALSVHLGHFYLLENFGNANASVWSVKVLSTVQVVIVWLVQCLYLIRIWNLSKRVLSSRKLVLILQSAIVILLAMGLGAGLVVIIGVDSIEVMQDLTKDKWAIYYLGFGVTAAIDMTISIIMVALLHRSITGIKRTDGVLSALIHYFFSMGILTSLTALAYIVLYSLMPEEMSFLGLAFPNSRLYTLSFLVLLNARDKLREDLDKTVTFEPDFDSLKIRFKAMTESSNSDPNSEFLTSRNSHMSPEIRNVNVSNVGSHSSRVEDIV